MEQLRGGCMSERIKVIIYRWLQKQHWKRAANGLRHKVTRHCQKTSINPGTIVILIPHADDEWVGCSQLIMKQPDNILLFNMNMDGGDSCDLHALRYNELKQVAKKYNLPLTTAGLEDYSKVSKIEEIILQEKPSYIAVPFYYDWHAEHVMTMRFLKAALESINKSNEELVASIKILMYQVSVPVPDEMVTNCLPMNKELHLEKWSIFDTIYKTQSGVPWFRFQCNERINGALCNAYAAEVYVCKKAIVWLEELPSAVLNDEETKKVLSNLQDLYMVRKEVNSIKEHRASIK